MGCFLAPETGFLSIKGKYNLLAKNYLSLAKA
jgi:hypothetical protein